jgi:hypothetical protein
MIRRLCLATEHQILARNLHEPIQIDDRSAGFEVSRQKQMPTTIRVQGDLANTAVIVRRLVAV